MCVRRLSLRLRGGGDPPQIRPEQDESKGEGSESKGEGKGEGSEGKGEYYWAKMTVAAELDEVFGKGEDYWRRQVCDAEEEEIKAMASQKPRDEQPEMSKGMKTKRLRW